MMECLLVLPRVESTLNRECCTGLILMRCVYVCVCVCVCVFVCLFVVKMYSSGSLNRLGLCNLNLLLNTE